MRRVVMMVGLFALIVGTAGCWWTDKPSQTPEECKVTTDPEACRKAYQRR